MIKINKIDSPKISIYTPDGLLLGIINEYEFLDVRVQIKKAQISGYYIEFNNEVIRIDKNGKLERYPDGLLDIMADFYMELI